MARPLRIEFDGAWYHVLNRGASHRTTFLEDADYKNFLSLVTDCNKIFALEVHAYCLMPNHYHLLVKTPNANLSRIMRYLNGVYTQRFNKVHQQDGALFKGRYKAILVDADSYLLQVARYIHLNPVKTNLVSHLENYPWSSYLFYLNPQQKPRFLNLNTLLGFFGSSTSAVEKFQKFTLAGIDHETQKFYSNKKLKPIFGKKPFMEKIKTNFVSSVKDNPEIPQQKELSNDRHPVAEIIHLVSQAHEVCPDTLLRVQSGKNNEARSIAIYLSRILCGLTLKQIAETFGQCSDSAIGNTVARITTKLQSQQELNKKIEELKQLIYSKTVTGR